MIKKIVLKLGEKSASFILPLARSGGFFRQKADRNLVCSVIGRPQKPLPALLVPAGLQSQAAPRRGSQAGIGQQERGRLSPAPMGCPQQATSGFTAVTRAQSSGNRADSSPHNRGRRSRPQWPQMRSCGQGPIAVSEEMEAPVTTPESAENKSNATEASSDTSRLRRRQVSLVAGRAKAAEDRPVAQGTAAALIGRVTAGAACR
ncbi:hypothetical protein SKAU_G00186840 [Synaphobranchus kaupii]|uniref:Uncharacterized protein n=1 Tax=Synaphobranchus kaupii TaxID=118154 RepID=A0A9Q1FCN4_SYNKA|nr:hypothetical protein SKAU_G00186840 [Synaphobranchus kaupii]